MEPGYSGNFFSPQEKPEIAYSDKYAVLLDGKYFHTIEQAYNLANYENIVLRFDIHHGQYILTEKDMIGIAEHHPPVNWKDFLKMKRKRDVGGIQYFLDQYPELKIVHKLIFIEDAFYYSLGTTTTTLELLTPVINRYKLFINNKEIAQPLLLKLYESLEKYMEAISEKSIFEQYIWGFNTHIDDDDMIINISQRIGIALNPLLNTADQFYEYLEYVFEKIKGLDNSKIEKVINSNQMNPNRLIEYLEYA